MEQNPTEQIPDEKTRIAKLNSAMDKVTAGLAELSDFADEKTQNDILKVISAERRSFLGEIEEQVIGDELKWFDLEWDRASECAGNRGEVNEAIKMLKDSLLALRGTYRREEGEEALTAARQDVVACLNNIAQKAEDVRLGGERRGAYGHRLLSLAEKTVSCVFGISLADASNHPSVCKMREVVCRFTNEEDL